MSQSNFFVFCVFLEPDNLVRSVYFNCFYSSSFTDCICFFHCPAHGEATLPSRVCSLCMSGSLPEMLLFLEVCLQYPLGLQFVKITSLYLALFFSCEDNLPESPIWHLQKNCRCGKNCVYVAKILPITYCSWAHKGHVREQRPFELNIFGSWTDVQSWTLHTLPRKKPICSWSHNWSLSCTVKDFPKAI